MDLYKQIQMQENHEFRRGLSRPCCLKDGWWDMKLDVTWARWDEKLYRPREMWKCEKRRGLGDPPGDPGQGLSRLVSPSQELSSCGHQRTNFLSQHNSGRHQKFVKTRGFPGLLLAISQPRNLWILPPPSQICRGWCCITMYNIARLFKLTAKKDLERNLPYSSSSFPLPPRQIKIHQQILASWCQCLFFLPLISLSVCDWIQGIVTGTRQRSWGWRLITATGNTRVTTQNRYSAKNDNGSIDIWGLLVE